jgi:type IV secretory pathway VirB2 component (pilin)
VSPISFLDSSASLADPGGGSVLVAAVMWLEQTVLGTIATTIAVIAIAYLGFTLLSGRVSLRYGATVVLGCFILFGAPAIVAGIQSFVGGGDMRAVSYRADPELPAPPPPSPAVSDPYAGASVPRR